MSGPDARYAFLPWLRRGLSAAAVLPSSTPARRLQVPVEVGLGAGRVSSVVLEMAGPGEVVGLDRRMIVRTWPRANVRDAEPSYFPMVEFDQADLPWRYSPIAAPADDRLLPWLCLIVLADTEVVATLPATATRPLPVVQVDDAPLPRPDQAWAWAHAQVAGVDAVTPTDAAALLASEPHRLTARLLSPRRLEAQTGYTALLVPAFESGRRAGLGLPQDDAADPLAPAWAAAARAAQLPVYYQWQFATGAVGDFEELVRRLSPDVLPDTVGRRAMDVGDPGAVLPPAASAPLGLEGALRAPTMTSTPWPDAERATFVGALGAFLNRPADLLADGGGVRAVSAPLYGRWYAAHERLAPDAPRWYREANADPRWRVAAGLGAQVIQANQRQLVDAAFQQVAGLPDVNDTLRGLLVSRELALRMQRRHLADADDELVLQLTAPAHQRVRASPITVAARLAESPVIDGLLGAGWRRVSRPLGRIGRRQARPRGERSQVVARVNREALSPASTPPTPAVLATPSRAGRALARRLVPIGVGLLVAGLLGIVLILLLPLAALAVVAGIAALGAAPRLRARAERLAAELAVRNGTLTSATVLAIAAPPDFVAREDPPGTPFRVAASSGAPSGAPTGTAPGATLGTSSSASARDFRAATAALLDRVAAEVDPPPPSRPVALRALRDRVLAELDPRATIGARVRDRLQLDLGVVWQPADPLEPVLVGPDFPQPMYRYLVELSADWLLPGVDAVRANSVTLAETNQAFVESYMLGLNHEMGAELLWREYPADQRRTFFRQFWDPVAFVPPPGQARVRETLEDILPIHRWAPGAALGESAPRTGDTRERLVVLIRGDVVRHYPTLTVYAARAVLGSDGRRAPGDDERSPVFGGTLGADLAFYGFSLAEAEVRGSATGGDLGWFFVLQEPASEPRFGLDVSDAGAPPPATWNDLSWGQLMTPADGLGAVDYIDLDAELPDTRAITDPPGVAWHATAGLGATGTDAAQIAFATLQRPMRVAIHANDMLGPAQ